MKKLFKKRETYDEIIARLYELTDKGDYGICSPLMDAQTALNELKDFFLGKDWYVVAPMHQEQINFNIVCEIEMKLSKFKMN